MQKMNKKLINFNISNKYILSEDLLESQAYLELVSGVNRTNISQDYNTRNKIFFLNKKIGYKAISMMVCITFNCVFL